MNELNTLDHDKLIKEIKGITRIVINACHGGFGLSSDGILRYLELCGTPVWQEATHSMVPFKHWLVPPGPERITEPSPQEWSSMTLTERQRRNQIYSTQVFYDRDIPRDDPFLVKTVLELGDKANGNHAELKVIEIPANVDWIIEDYDGKEWVAEKHRTWS
jgi:hypothetical protein